MMRNIQMAGCSRGYNNDEHTEEEEFRDIHALTPTVPSRQRSSNLSVASEVTNSSENFSTMSREFNALVLAGTNIEQEEHHNNNSSLDRIGEDEEQENNPLAIVPDTDTNPLPEISRNNNSSLVLTTHTPQGAAEEIGVERVKRDEVDAKITAWQTAKIAKINNRFKREDAIITGWENEQVHKASTWMKIFQRKLEEKRAKALEKMENDIAKARRKAEERRASAEAKRGTKAAKVLQVANLMRAVGRPPAKRSFF